VYDFRRQLRSLFAYGVIGELLHQHGDLLSLRFR
jgi:hypothetical protein